MEELIQDPKWKPSDKLWYNKFCYSVLLGPFNPDNLLGIDRPYRTRCTWIPEKKPGEGYTVLVRVYLDDIKMVKGLISKYPYIEVQSPMNKQHEDILTDKKSIIREKLWHGKYKYRLETFKSFYWSRFTLSSSKDGQDVIEARRMIIDLFGKNSHIRSANWSQDDVPFVYTNDERSLMLYKMRFMESFRIIITEAITFDEIRQMA